MYCKIHYKRQTSSGIAGRRARDPLDGLRFIAAHAKHNKTWAAQQARHLLAGVEPWDEAAWAALGDDGKKLVAKICILTKYFPSAPSAKARLAAAFDLISGMRG
ncbi:MAG: hypothetical protein JRN68_09570 [Nitrososphaerota archaeon]|nr:hypothetical protein [Ferrimicrobium acidiphilum]MDG6934929.1 hypothetical protein [Nitrososphaerota archaeon]